MVLVFILYAILAATFWFAKKGVETGGPCFLIGFRMTLAGLFLLAYQWRKNHRVFSEIKKKDLLSLFNASLFYVYLAFVPEFWGLKYVSAVKTTMIYSLTPFITAILAYALYKQKLTAHKISGILLGVIGIIPVLIAQSNTAKQVAHGWSFFLPEIALFVAVASSAYAWFLIKDLIGKGFPIAFINGMTMLMGGIVSWITSLFLEGLVPPIIDFWPFLFWVFMLIISANIIFNNLYAWLMRHYSITFLSFAGFLCPLFATFYEWLLTGDNVSWHYAVCLVCVTLGLFVFYKDEFRYFQR
jgi:drug/metabolite transporter (DMT)-like permease